MEQQLDEALVQVTGKCTFDWNAIKHSKSNLRWNQSRGLPTYYNLQRLDPGKIDSRPTFKSKGAHVAKYISHVIYTWMWKASCTINWQISSSVAIIDHHFRYCWIYHTESGAEAFSTLCKWLSMVERDTVPKRKALPSGNGCESSCSEMNTFLTRWEVV